MATLPAITFSATASATEVWDAFWEGSWVLSTLDDTNLNFGNDYDFSSTSRNLAPRKIWFYPVSGGHDHSLIGTRLHARSVSKRSLDLNGLHITWVDYWNDGGADVGTKYVVLTGVLTMDGNNKPDGGGGSYAANEPHYTFIRYSPIISDPNSGGNNASKLDAVRTSDFDTTYWTTPAGTIKVLAIFATPRKAIDDQWGNPALPPSCWIRNSAPTANNWAVVECNFVPSTTDATFDVTVFARMIGPEA